MLLIESLILINNLQAILFDLDGVLVDACDWHYEALNKALIDMGHNHINKEEHISKYNGLPTRIKLNMLGIDESQAHKINNLKQQHTLDIIKNKCKVMPEKIQLHNFLKQNNIKIACVTNSIRETATDMLKASGQFEFIDLLIANEDVTNNKPNPDCYNYAIDILKADPMLSICVEDSPKGIEAAVSSKIKFLWKVKNTSEVTLHNFKQFIGNQ